MDAPKLGPWLTLPWPPAVCSPNARVHWTVRARAVKAYRRECWALAKQAGVCKPRDNNAVVTVEFCVPDGRRRDDDNIIAAFKSGRDGLADAMGIDDSQFTFAYRINRKDRIGVVRVFV